jgi:hypothetical protein
MKTTKIYTISLTVIFVLTISQPTFAQQVVKYYNQWFNNQLSNRIWEGILEQSSPGFAAEMKKLRDSKSKSKSSNQTSTASKSSNQTSTVLNTPSRKTFQFKSTGTRLTVQEYIDKVELNPQQKAELKMTVLEILDLYEAQAPAKSLPNDLALAVASYIGLMSHVYHGKTEKPLIPFEQDMGWRGKVAEHFTQNGTFDEFTDRHKQELYELLVFTAGLTFHFYTKALNEKNDDDLKVLKLEAANGLRRLGIEP